MKTENTPENKARFFALYAFTIKGPLFHTQIGWQYCNIIQLPCEYNKVDERFHGTKDPEISFWQLPLTPLSQISDEDAYYVGATVNCWSWAERKQTFFKDDEMSETHIGFGKMFASSIGKEFGRGLSQPFAHNSTDILHAYDYLRSKGYALPWMGLSVDDQIEYGWVKLKTR